MPQIEIDERRARLLTRHHLATRAGAVEEVAGTLAGLHASDPCSVYLAAWARTEGFTVAGMEASLYERRSLVRMLGMRRTMFVVPAPHAPVMDAACTQALVATERRKLVRLVDVERLAPDAERWVDDIQARVLATLAAKGEATAAQLSAAIPELAQKFRFGEGTAWSGSMGLSTRVLFLLATEGRVVRGRPLGSWISSQYRWTPTATWLGAELEPITPAAARSLLLRRWLAAFGPATETDIRWWTGWTARFARAALTDLDAVTVTIDDGHGTPATGYVLPDDAGHPGGPAPARRVALLPALDPTTMGWKQRAWYLGPHAGPLFDRNGNAGPTVWIDGRVVGAWGQPPGGGVVTALLEKVDSEAEDLVATEAAALERWLAGVRVVPRFPAPLQRELSR